MKQYSEMTVPELRNLYYLTCQRQIDDFEELDDLNIENGGGLIDEISERMKKLVAIYDELMKRGFTEHAYYEEYEKSKDESEESDGAKTNLMECKIDSFGKVICIQNGNNGTQIGFIENFWH